MEALTIFGRLLVGAAGRPLGTATANKLFGEADLRTLEGICIKTVERATREVAGASADPAMIKHVVSLLTRALPDDIQALPLVPHDVGDANIERMAQAMRAQGIDFDTLPLPASLLLRRIAELFPEEVRKSAAHGEGSFAPLVLRELEDTRDRLAQLTSAHYITPLSEDCKAVLYAARHLAESRNQSLYTPHLMLSLLRSASGFTRRAFDRALGPLSRQVEEDLHRYIKTADLPHFEPFVIEHRPEVAEAGRIARREALSYITEPCLLVGILRGESSTVRQLQKSVSPRQWKILLEFTQRSLTPPKVLATPGSIIEGPRE